MLGTVLEIVRGARPLSQCSESEFQDVLVTALREAMPSGAKIIREFKANQSRRLDIGIHYERRWPAPLSYWLFGGIIGGIIKSAIPEKHKIYIEIKKDLSEQNELHRLIGQISINEQEGYVPLIVLLFGKTDLQMKESLEHFLEGHQNIHLLDTPYPPLLAQETKSS